MEGLLNKVGIGEVSIPFLTSLRAFNGFSTHGGAAEEGTVGLLETDTDRTVVEVVRIWYSVGPFIYYFIEISKMVDLHARHPLCVSTLTREISR